MRIPNVTAGFCLAVTALFSLPAWAACSGMTPGSVDTNGDFAISRAEAQGTKLAGVFTDADANNDGVIVHSEWGHACSLMESGGAGGLTGAVGDYVGGQAERQRQRQTEHVDSRVQQEANQASDSIIESALDSLFGN